MKYIKNTLCVIMTVIFIFGSCAVSYFYCDIMWKRRLWVAGLGVLDADKMEFVLKSREDIYTDVREILQAAALEKLKERLQSEAEKQSIENQKPKHGGLKDANDTR